MKRYPDFLAPGWCAAYVTSACLWLAILDQLGVLAAIGLVVFGLLALGAVWDWTSREGGKRS